MTTTASFFGQKLKGGVILYMYLIKTNYFCCLVKFSKSLIFFNKKVGFITLVFQIINANLLSIYSKIFEFMVYTFICAL